MDNLFAAIDIALCVAIAAALYFMFRATPKNEDESAVQPVSEEIQEKNNKSEQDR